MNFISGNTVIIAKIATIQNKFLNDKPLDIMDDKFNRYIESINKKRHEEKAVTCREVQILELVKKLQDGFENTGLYKMKTGTCPSGANNCIFCPYGHYNECHWKKTCAEAKCSHYKQEVTYREELEQFESETWIKNHVLCCVCQQSLKESNLNYFQVVKKVTWENPKYPNFITGEYNGQAILCDSCCKQNIEPVFVLEYTNGKVIYHHINELEDA